MHRYFVPAQSPHHDRGTEDVPSVATSDMPSCCRKQSNPPVEGFRCTACGAVWRYPRRQSPRQPVAVDFAGREYEVYE